MTTSVYTCPCNTFKCLLTPHNRVAQCKSPPTVRVHTHTQHLYTQQHLYTHICAIHVHVYTHYVLTVQVSCCGACIHNCTHSNICIHVSVQYMYMCTHITKQSLTVRVSSHGACTHTHATFVYTATCVYTHLCNTCTCVNKTQKVLTVRISSRGFAGNPVRRKSVDLAEILKSIHTHSAQ